MKMYEVTVPGFGTATVTAKSRSAAKYDAYLNDAFGDMKFGEFLALGVSARKVSRVLGPDEDGYDYVRRYYGVNVRIGDKVQLVDEGSASGKICEVIYPGQSTAHVHLLIDGQKGIVHPLNVECLEAS